MSFESRELRLIKPVDSGDLATVYLAMDPSHGSVSRAVSVFHSDLEQVQELAAQVHERVKLARGLNHSAVVRSEGVFLVGGQPALVSEWVEGKDLERISKRKAVPSAVAAKICSDVLAALIAAKEHGIVHGLIGPNRIRLDTMGQVRLLGLGSEKGLSVDADDALFREDRSTRRYAPPELVGGMLTSASDIYSVGAVLTRIISGRWPKRASNHSAGQNSVAEGARTICAHAGASDALADLVRDCLGFRSDLRPYLDEAIEILQAESASDSTYRDWLTEAVLSPSDFTEDMDLAATELVEPDEIKASVDGQENRGSALANPDLTVTELNEPEDEAVQEQAAVETIDGESQQPSMTSDEPEILGALPPPNVEEVSRPLAVAVPAGDELTEEDTECTADPDTVDEPTEEAKKKLPVEIDEHADRWDRMLGLDVKANDTIDKEWIRAARGESEYRRFALWGAVIVFVAILGAWKLDVFNATSGSPLNPQSSQDDGAGAEVKEAQTSSAVPSPPVPEPIPEPVPEPVPDPVPEPIPEPVPEPVPDPVPEPVPSPVPEPVPVPEPLPTPVPEPEPTSSPAPEPVPRPEPPASATAAFRVTGDAHQVQLVSNERRVVSGGRVPAGTYAIQVVFKPGDAPRNQGNLTLQAGESAIVNCKGSFYRCTIRGPWK